MATPSAGYTLADGTKVPGTTTIIGRFKESGALINWAYNQGREHEGLARQGKPAPRHLRDVVDDAADIGTVVHEMVEASTKGAPAEALHILVDKLADEDARKKAWSGFHAFEAWAKASRFEIIYQEISLVSEDYRYGGTPDAIGKVGGELSLIDYKTSGRVYTDHLIQVAAYKHLIENGVRLDTRESLAINLTGGFHILRFSKEHGDFSHHHFPNLDEAWEQFLLFRRAYELDKLLKKRAA